MQTTPPKEKADVLLTYTTPRGRWYHVSWKGTEEKSGGLAMNIGIHLFDMMLWLFGPVSRVDVFAREPDRVSGTMELQHANVRWFLSTRHEDVPEEARNSGQVGYRSIQMNGKEIEFSTGFTDLHTKVYEEILAGRGFGIDDARPSIELAYKVRTQPIVAPRGAVHPSYHP
ncbi:MAG: Gfo/Idh/MocA family oxidoreductase [Polyangiales bacterium]